MPFQPGQNVSHYRLVEKVGEGGMGVVWKAVDTTLDREVAIKLLPEEVASDPLRLERFEREAKLLAALNHPRIASLYGLHQAAGVHFLSMELIEGEDLAGRLSRGPLTLDQALPVALQVVEGLEAAHERGIIHRDLKPGNIKLTVGGDVKILDFGLAKALQPAAAGSSADLSQSPTMTAAATQAGVILGTAAYMSPEQARGQEADRRTDVWAFGCVLYEMLTGRGTFHGATASDCLAGILAREPDWGALPPGTPAGVRRLLRRCLEKDARRRLHDIADARIEIQETLAGAEAGTPGREEWPPGRKRAPFAWAAAGLVVGAALAALLLPWRSGPAGASAVRSPGRFIVQLPQESPLLPTPGTSSVAVSPDGTVLVYVGVGVESAGASVLGDRPSAFNRSQLFARRIDEYEARPLEGTAGAAGPFFSPDGNWVGFVEVTDGKLMKTRLQGGVPVPIDPEPLDVRGASWGEDGRIYLGSAGTGIYSIPEDGGELTTLTSPDRERGEKSHRFPSLLPGGRRLLFTLSTGRIASYDEAGIAILDLETGEYRVLMEGGTQPSYVATGHLVYGRAGSLLAVPFDLDAGEITGPPFEVGAAVLTSDGWGSAHYSVSATGMLAYVAGGPELFQLPIYWLDRQGHVERVPLEPRPYGKAVFSPDGGRLALSSLGGNASIWVYDIERQTATRLTHEWDNYAPIWTRSGRYVTYNSDRSATGQLWQVAADGSSPPQPLAPDKFNGNYYPGSWSVGDRSLLLSAAGPGTGLDLWLLRADEGAKTEPFLQTGFDETDPAISPDGRWLAYTSNASGQTELYVQPFPDGGRRWQISAGGGQSPLWSPDGRELFYWKGRRLMAVSVTTESGFVPGKERELPQPQFSDLAGWDIAPDGKRFVVVGRLVEDASTTSGAAPGTARGAGGLRGKLQSTLQEIDVVTDWFDELRRNPAH